MNHRPKRSRKAKVKLTLIQGGRTNDPVIPCSWCDANGAVPCECEWELEDPDVDEIEPCEECEGTHIMMCPRCEGTGHEPTD